MSAGDMFWRWEDDNDHDQNRWYLCMDVVPDAQYARSVKYRSVPTWITVVEYNELHK